MKLITQAALSALSRIVAKSFLQLQIPDPILYYVSGDGQQGAAGSELTNPLIAGIEMGNVPAEGLTVIFKIVTEGGELRDREGNTSITELPIKSNDEGLVACNWTLGSSGDQHVEAFLIDDDQKSCIFPSDTVQL